MLIIKSSCTTTLSIYGLFTLAWHAPKPLRHRVITVPHNCAAATASVVSSSSVRPLSSRCAAEILLLRVKTANVEAAPCAAGGHKVKCKRTELGRDGCATGRQEVRCKNAEAISVTTTFAGALK